jgi:hypothetical protein
VRYDDLMFDLMGPGFFVQALSFGSASEHCELINGGADLLCGNGITE